jgi:hypothetical protein
VFNVNCAVLSLLKFPSAKSPAYPYIWQTLTARSNHPSIFPNQVSATPLKDLSSNYHPDPRSADSSSRNLETSKPRSLETSKPRSLETSKPQNLRQAPTRANPNRQPTNHPPTPLPAAPPPPPIKSFPGPRKFSSSFPFLSLISSIQEPPALRRHAKRGIVLGVVDTGGSTSWLAEGYSFSMGLPPFPASKSNALSPLP